MRRNIVTDNVVNIQGKMFTEGSAEELMKAVKSGNIRSIGLVIIESDGTIVTDYSFEDGANRFSMLGAIEHLKNRLWTELIKD